MADIVSLLLRDPYRVYRMMRRKSPVLFDPKLELWLVFRYADVRAMVTSDDVSNDRRAIRRGYTPRRLPDPDQNRLMEELERHMLLSEGPEHTRRRAAVARAFSPKIVATLQARVEAIVDGLLDEMAAQRDVDFVDDFARKLPTYVISEVLGLPTQDRPAFKRWTEALVLFNDPTKSVRECTEAFSSMPAMKDYFEQMFERRRREPENDLITTLVSATDDERLDPTELVATCSILMAAGHETTMHTLGNGLVTLESHPQHRKRLREQPELWPAAVEEFLRYCGPVHFQQRQTVRDCVIGGQRIPAGYVVMPAFASANRDPDAFERPDELDFDRPRNPHMAFGYGRHHCIGATLARLELRVAFRRLFERFPNYQLDLTSIERRNSVWMQGLDHLRMGVDQRDGKAA